MAENLGEKPEPDDGSADPFDREFDEEFVKAADAKEPSARARELTAKWAKEAPKPTVWRGDAPVPPPAAPPSAPRPSAPRRSTPKSPVTDWPPKPRKKRVWPRNFAMAVVAAAVVGIIAYPRHHVSAPVFPTPVGTGQWNADADPTPSPSYAHPDDQYFAGSPAIAWADNAAGIVPPKAHSLGQFSASEIAAGYQGLRQLLTAGNLDATILNGGPTTDFTNLLDTRTQLGTQLNSWIAHPTYQNNPTSMITRFNPATTRLLGHTVKVNGTMTASIDKQNGFLAVSADYRFVYAVGPANGNGYPSRTIVDRIYQLELSTPDVFDAQTGRYWITDYNGTIANNECFQYNGFINPTFGTYDGSPRSGKTVDPYASGQPLVATSPTAPTPTGSPGECDSVSRT